MRATKKKIGIALLAALVVIAASLHVYLIRDDTGGYALWNHSEAYFFITVPDNERQSLVVVRVTSAGAERHDLKQEDSEPGSTPGVFTPREGRIYATCPALGGLCIWAGDHFERAPEAERQAGPLQGLIERNFENDEHGWSKRGFAVMATDSNFTIGVGDEFKLAVNAVAAKKNVRGAISIDVLQHSQDPTRVFSFDVRNERIGRSEYEYAFRSTE
jgi:hypothetical protein